MGGRFFHLQDQDLVAACLTQVVCEGILEIWVHAALVAKSVLRVHAWVPNVVTHGTCETCGICVLLREICGAPEIHAGRESLGMPEVI